MNIQDNVVYQQTPTISFSEYAPHGVAINTSVRTNSSIHNHKDIEFKYIMNNSGSKVIIGNNEYPARKGDFITANSAVPHAFFTKDPFDYVTIIFATEHWLTYGVDVNSISFTEFVRDSRIDEIMETIVSEHYKKDSFYKLRINNYIDELAIHMLRNHTQKTLCSSEEFSRAQLNIANNVNEFLIQNYRRKIAIDEIASELGFNKSYMMRTYKKVTSMTIIEKLYAIRCNHATEKLSNHSLSITDIAYISGFESPSHFGKTYKSFTGMSPSEYRKKDSH